MSCRRLAAESPPSAAISQLRPHTEGSHAWQRMWSSARPHDEDDSGGSESARLERPITAFDLIPGKSFVPDELISATCVGIRRKAHRARFVFSTD